MEWPRVAPAPSVTEHAVVFRDRCDHPGQLRPCPHELTGLMVRPNQRLAQMACGLLASADQTPLSRVRSAAPWRVDAGHRRRRRVRRQQTKPHGRRRRESRVVLAETLGEPGGRRGECVDRHANHGDGTEPLAHPPVTSWSGRGPVRVALARRRDRRDEALTQGEAAVAPPVPDRQSPTDTTRRPRLHTPVDPVLRQDPAGRARHAPFQTNIALALELVEAALRGQVPVGVVVFDAWSLAEAGMQGRARRRTAWISVLNQNRLGETASVHLRAANGGPPPRRRGTGAAAPGPCVAPRHRPRAHLWGLDAGRPPPWLGPSPARGQ